MKALLIGGQDFEALTPNLLARTIETVEGGGIIVLLLSSLTSLTQLYTLTMDVHQRFRTDSHQQVTGAASLSHLASCLKCRAGIAKGVLQCSPDLEKSHMFAEAQRRE